MQKIRLVTRYTCHTDWVLGSQLRKQWWHWPVWVELLHVEGPIFKLYKNCTIDNTWRGDRVKEPIGVETKSQVIRPKWWRLTVGWISWLWNQFNHPLLAEMSEPKLTSFAKIREDKKCAERMYYIYNLTDRLFFPDYEKKHEFQILSQVPKNSGAV
jgi:hypothetical protein